ELASWEYEQDTWYNLMFGLRLGNDPRAVVTTTPKPLTLLRELVKREGTDVHITRGNTYENRSNLPEPFFREIIARYEGTRTGQQEIYAALLEEAEGAVWSRAVIEQGRVSKYPDLFRVVVGVDPPGGMTECGIVAVGLGMCSCKGKKPERHVFVIDDKSLHASPEGWAAAVLTAYTRNKADRIVGEANYGGDMVESTIRQAAKAQQVSVSYQNAHATRGKAIRAEPVAAAYERGEVHHVGMFAELEDEMCTWEPGISKESPNRLDALVWAATVLTRGNVAASAPVGGAKTSRWRS
ncbi:MAG: terminase family protein, partial [Dehalococcoidia bacterium]|nr:terminase family protein [Dehalococcoidia bacterium]